MHSWQLGMRKGRELPEHSQIVKYYLTTLKSKFLWLFLRNWQNYSNGKRNHLQNCPQWIQADSSLTCTTSTATFQIYRVKDFLLLKRFHLQRTWADSCRLTWKRNVSKPTIIFQYVCLHIEYIVPCLSSWKPHLHTGLTLNTPQYKHTNCVKSVYCFFFNCQSIPHPVLESSVSQSHCNVSHLKIKQHFELWHLVSQQCGWLHEHLQRRLINCCNV